MLPLVRILGIYTHCLYYWIEDSSYCIIVQERTYVKLQTSQNCRPYFVPFSIQDCLEHIEKIRLNFKRGHKTFVHCLL